MAGHRIVLTGGGTGGHIYPALAVCEELKEKPDVEAILYVGAQGHPEEKLASSYGIDFIGLPVSALPRKLSLKALSWPCQTMYAVQLAYQTFRRFKPTVVLGTGGYVIAPSLVAALMTSVPYAIHEPDAHPGLANRLFARFAKLCSLGMAEASGALKPKQGTVIVNGNPVRKSFINLPNRDTACAALGLQSDLKTILITGGSQGARAINTAVIEALPKLMALNPPIQIVHQVGKNNLSECEAQVENPMLFPRYFLRPYFDDLAVAYAACDLTVCRSGAMTIAELAVTGTPAVFIPYPYAAQDHQSHNAKSVASTGAALVLSQNELSANVLSDLLIALIRDESRLQQMRKNMLALGKPNAAHDLAQQLIKLSAEHLG